MSNAATLDMALFNAEHRCRSAQNIHELAFSIANETWQVWPYRQAQVWHFPHSKPQALAVSGLATLPEDSPFTVWAKRLLTVLRPHLGERLHLLNLEQITRTGQAPESMPDLNPDSLAGWAEWWPPHLILLPLFHQGQFLGLSLFVADQVPPRHALQALARLQLSWSYCFWALRPRRHANPLRRLPQGRRRWLLIGLVAGLLCLPVRESALAPAEIVPRDGTALSSPLDGVVKQFHIQPNQTVHAGQKLVSLDDTTLRNRREVSARALEVAAAELLSAQQRAFNDPRASAEVAVLQGRIAERKAELRAVQEQLARIHLHAPRDGVAVFSDVSDWQGKPVVTGERILQVADPSDVSVRLYLPVADAINLEQGAAIQVFLDVAPLNPLSAELSQTSYQSVLSPDGVASYNLRGQLLDKNRQHARIGLQGTAKVYGQKVPLAYYLLRRPIAAARQWSGW